MTFISDFYKEIFKLLDKEKLTKANHLPKLNSSVGYHGVKMLSSSEYPWIREVFLRFKEAAPQLIHPFLDGEYPPLFYKAPYSPGYAFNSFFDWTVMDQIFDVRANYSCLFPQRIIYLTYQFKYWEAGYWSESSDDEYCIPLDFLPQLFALKPALLNGIALLVPQRISKRDLETDSNFEYWGTYRYRNEPGTISLAANGLGYESLSRFQADQKLTLIDSQLIRTPWLLGAKLDKFVELIDKHPDEFFLYSSAFSRFFKASQPDIKLLVEWLEELAIATKQLDVIFRNKRRELVRDGVDVAVGTIFTIASLLVPDTYAPLKALAASVFGGKTTYEALTWIRDFSSAKEELSEDKYWILWRAMK